MADRNNIVVAARIRPLLPKEGTEHAVKSSHENNTSLVYVDRPGVNKQYQFDYVFSSETSQREVFQSVTPLLDSVLDGYNATILAYGQTGSGKTFTMGTDSLSLIDQANGENCDRRGVVPRATEYLFSVMADRRAHALSENHAVPEFSVSVVFVEIYNDDVIDLLSHRKNNNDSQPSMKRTNTVPKTKEKVKKPFVRINENGEIVLDGVTSIPCDSAAAVMSCLQDGSLARRTATTAYNERSSRSHAIFTVVVNQHRFVKKVGSNASIDKSEADDLSDEVLVAKMHFVDLAGSERLHDAIVCTGQAAHDRFREGVNINMGLLTLGKVISMLSEGKTTSQYIPYRDSKLTRLLQDSLGGNSRTLMIACVSAAECYIEQSLNTLQYATNARKIKNQAVVNRASSVSQLKAEIQMLRKKLDAKNGGVDKQLIVENTRLKTDNDELRAKVLYLEDLLKTYRPPVHCADGYSQTDTSPEAVISKEVVMQALCKLKSAGSPGASDSTLTDSKVQLTNSFRHIYDKIVEEGAELIVMKEQVASSTSSNSLPLCSPAPKLLTTNLDIGKIREVRERRRKRTTACLSSYGSDSSLPRTSLTSTQETPQPANTSQIWQEILGSAATNVEEDDDEHRDPTYEPTPLKVNPEKFRRHFECVQDAAGNRRLTRAACHQIDTDTFSSKRTKMSDQSDSENRPFCHCRGLCKATARCVCRKNNIPCQESGNDGSVGCGCDPSVCCNKQKSDENTTIDEGRETSQNVVAVS